MMRRSGVRSLVNLSKLAREMLRLAASGHIPSTQDSNLAAAARIARACISGWPEEPDSPLHSFGGVAAGAGVAVCAVTTFGLAADTGIGGIKRWAWARQGAALSKSAAPSIRPDTTCFGIGEFSGRMRNA